MRPSRVLAAVIVLALALVATTLAHASAAAAPKPKPNATQHIDMIYMSLVQSVTTPITGDANYKDLTVFIRVTDRNDVPVPFSLSPVNITDAYQEPLTEDSVCGYGVPDALAKAAYPALCKQDWGNKLFPRQSIYGSITYKVPTSQHHALLIWNPSSPDYSITWPTRTWTITYK